MSESVEIVSYALSDVGRKRSGNEDAILISEPDQPDVLADSGRLYIAADGVGGAAKGEVASRLAAATVQREYYRYPQIDPGERLKRAINAANDAVYAESQRSGSRQRMATTLVAAALHGSYLTVAWVGDSRAYLFREGAPWQITVDHTVVQEMIRNGEMTEAEAQISSARNRLARSVGGDEDVHVDVIAQDIHVQAGDTLVLCTDGLTKYADGPQIGEIIAGHAPKEAAQRLVNHANQAGGADNVSVIVVEVRPSSAATVVMRLPNRLPAGQPPADMDLELLETQNGRRSRPARGGVPVIRELFPRLGPFSQLLILNVLVLIILGLGGGLALLTLWNPSAPIPTQPPSTAAAIGAATSAPTGSPATAGEQTLPPAVSQPVIAPAETTPYPVVGQPPAVPSVTPEGAALLPGNNTIPVITATPNQVLPATTEAIVVSVITPEPNSNLPPNQSFYCVRKVGPNEGLSTILHKNVVDTETYWAFPATACLEIEGKLSCEGLTRIIEGPLYILQPDEWVIIPDIQNPNICVSEYQGQIAHR